MLDHVLQAVLIPHVSRVLVATTHRQLSAVREASTHMTPRIIDVGDRTDGQLDTVLRALEQAGLEEDDWRVLVVNCDNVFDCNLGVILSLLQHYELALVTHLSDNPACSYVDQVPCPTRYAEKQRISRHAMSGAWAFRSGRALLEEGRRVMREGQPAHNGEFYLSQVLHAFRPAFAISVEEGIDFQDWGTPDALEAAGARVLA